MLVEETVASPSSSQTTSPAIKPVDPTTVLNDTMEEEQPVIQAQEEKESEEVVVEKVEEQPEEAQEKASVGEVATGKYFFNSINKIFFYYAKVKFYFLFRNC